MLSEFQINWKLFKEKSFLITTRLKFKIETLQLVKRHRVDGTLIEYTLLTLGLRMLITFLSLISKEWKDIWDPYMEVRTCGKGRLMSCIIVWRWHIMKDENWKHFY